MLEWESRNRRTIPVFHALALAYCVEVALGVFGVILVSDPRCGAKSELYVLEMILIIAIFADFLILGFVLGLLLWATRGKKPRPLSDSSYQKSVGGLLRLMSVLCCGLFGSVDSPMGNQEFAWSEISRIVHAFLKDTLVDFTVPDVFTAFVLLRAEQRAMEARRVEKALSTPGLKMSSPKSPNVRFKSQSFTASTPITGGDSKAVDAMRDFDEFAPYMIGIYGWKLQLYMNPFRFLCSFPVNMARKLASGKEVEHHIFKATIGSNSKKRKIVYSSFTSYLGEAIPYTITVDHEKKAVVITLRGTMSVGDIATDLLCSPAKLDMAERQWGVKNGSKHYTHSGMLAVANRIRTDIERQQILHRLMRVPVETEEQQKARESYGSERVSVEDRESFLKAMGKSKHAEIPEGMMYATEVFVGDRELSALNCSDYRLICCGHSLGSCMAAILSLLLRPRFPKIRCLAYSCVSAIFSRELAEESEAWILSITAGKDIFGRISWHSAKKLRDQLLDVIRRSKASKSKILLSLLSRRGVPIEDLIYPPDEVPDELPRREIQARLNRLGKLEDHELDSFPMFMPGRIIYMEKTHTEVHRGWVRNYSRSTYTPVWIDNREEIQQVQISSRLILDHMPDYLMKVMRNAMHREVTAHINGQKRLLAPTSGEFVPPRDLDV